MYCFKWEKAVKKGPTKLDMTYYIYNHKNMAKQVRLGKLQQRSLLDKQLLKK